MENNYGIISIEYIEMQIEALRRLQERFEGNVEAQIGLSSQIGILNEIKNNITPIGADEYVVDVKSLSLKLADEMLSSKILLGTYKYREIWKMEYNEEYYQPEELTKKGEEVHDKYTDEYYNEILDKFVKIK